MAAPAVSPAVRRSPTHGDTSSADAKLRAEVVKASRTLEELADSLDLTRERVRQIQLEALGQLRRIIKRRGVSKDVLL